MIKSWNEKKSYLEELIKKVSDVYGGDDSAFIAEYCADVIKNYSNDMEAAIQCFESIIESPKIGGYFSANADAADAADSADPPDPEELLI